MTTAPQQPDNHDAKTDALVALFLFVLLMIVIGAFVGCSPKIIEHTRTQIEYRDRIVHDTATVSIPVEVEKIVTKDTTSHLETTYAKSDASVSGGFLTHSLESKPQIIKVPVEVHVTDTLIQESEVKTEYVEVEKKLTKMQKTKQDSFWGLILSVVLLLAWTFRKPILKLIKLI